MLRIWERYGPAIIKVATGIWDRFAVLAGAALDVVVTVFDTAFSVIGGLFEFFAALLTLDFGRMREAVVGISVSMWEGVKGIYLTGVRTVLAFVRDFVESGFEIAARLAGRVSTRLADAIRAGADAATGALDRVIAKLDEARARQSAGAGPALPVPAGVGVPEGAAAAPPAGATTPPPGLKILSEELQKLREQFLKAEDPARAFFERLREHAKAGIDAARFVRTYAADVIRAADDTLIMTGAVSAQLLTLKEQALAVERVRGERRRQVAEEKAVREATADVSRITQQLSRVTDTQLIRSIIEERARLALARGEVLTHSEALKAGSQAAQEFANRLRELDRLKNPAATFLETFRNFDDANRASDFLLVWNQRVIEAADRQFVLTGRVDEETASLARLALQIRATQAERQRTLQEQQALRDANLEGERVVRRLAGTVDVDLLNAVIAQRRGTALARGETDSWAEAMRGGISLAEQLAASVRDGSESFFGQIENLRALGIATTEELSTLPGVAQRDLDAATLAFSRDSLDRLGTIPAQYDKDLARMVDSTDTRLRGQASQLFLQFAQDVQQRTGQLPQGFASVMQQLVFSQDLVLRGQARDIWEDYIAFLREKGLQIPEEFKGIQQGLAEEAGRFQLTDLVEGLSAGTDSISGQFGRLGEAFQSSQAALQQWAAGKGSFLGAMGQITAGVIKNARAQAAIQTIVETAKGFAALAKLPPDPRAAALHFISAAQWGILAAKGSGGGKAAGAGAGAGASAGGAAQTRQAPPPPPPPTDISTGRGFRPPAGTIVPNIANTFSPIIRQQAPVFSPVLPAPTVLPIEPRPEADRRGEEAKSLLAEIRDEMRRRNRSADDQHRESIDEQRLGRGLQEAQVEATVRSGQSLKEGAESLVPPPIDRQGIEDGFFQRQRL